MHVLIRIYNSYPKQEMNRGFREWMEQWRIRVKKEERD